MNTKNHDLRKKSHCTRMNISINSTLFFISFAFPPQIYITDTLKSLPRLTEQKSMSSLSVLQQLKDHQVIISCLESKLNIIYCKYAELEMAVDFLRISW